MPTSAVKVGAQVTIGGAMTMNNFESKTLGRKFDRIVFGQIDAPGAAPGAPHGAPAPAAAAAKVDKVDKASGPDARTVAEVVKGKSALKDKTVLVRGRVVKVSAGILGKNWLHLQDGSGSAAVGDIVNAKGMVRTDVTVGPGYSYAVLIEDAAVRK